MANNCPKTHKIWLKFLFNNKKFNCLVWAYFIIMRDNSHCHGNLSHAVLLIIFRRMEEQTPLSVLKALLILIGHIPYLGNLTTFPLIKRNDEGKYSNIINPDVAMTCRIHWSICRRSLLAKIIQTKMKQSIPKRGTWIIKLWMAPWSPIPDLPFKICSVDYLEILDLVCVIWIVFDFWAHWYG
jgi:hypothetical protein